MEMVLFLSEPSKVLPNISSNLNEKKCLKTGFIFDHDCTTLAKISLYSILVNEAVQSKSTRLRRGKECFWVFFLLNHIYKFTN